MTVIIYDGEAIAADRQLTVKSTIVGYEKKILKWSKGWYAASGIKGMEPAIKEYLETGTPYKGKDKWDCLYSKNGKVFYLHSSGLEYEALVPYGIGDGGNDAEVLCRIGFTAKEAAKEVCEWNINCGGTIDEVVVV